VPEGTILVIDDQRELADLVRRALERERFEVLIATSGESGLRVAREHSIDLVVLDLTMPDLDGLDVCRQLRADPRRSTLPIIVLSARASAADRALGLEVGADDYVIKPFEARELVARVRAVLRRAKPATQTPSLILAGEVTLDPVAHRVTYRGAELRVTAAEFRILQLFATHPGRAFSRDEIIDSALGPDAAVTTRTVDAHIVNLRRKLGGDGSALIETVWGVGYRLRV
jgi:DNA-binding response OmpR family regulator